MTMLGPSSDPLSLDDVRKAFNDYRRPAMRSASQRSTSCGVRLYCFKDNPKPHWRSSNRVFSQPTQNSERIFEAELYRLKSRTLLARGAVNANAECTVAAPSGINNSQKSTRAIAGISRREGPCRALDGSGQTRRSYRPSQVYCGVVSGWPRHAKLKGDKGRRLIDNDKGCLSNPRRLLPYPPLLRLRLLFLVYDSGMSCRIFPAVGFLLIFFVSSIGRQIPTLFPFFEIAL